MYSTNSRVTFVTEKMKQFSELFKLFKIQDRSQAAVNDLASLQPFPNGLLLHSAQSFPGVSWFDSDACWYFALRMSKTFIIVLLLLLPITCFNDLI